MALQQSVVVVPIEPAQATEVVAGRHGSDQRESFFSTDLVHGHEKAIYGGLLSKIARSPRHIVGNRRLRLSSLRKGMIALQARWAAGRRAEAPPTVSEA